MLLRLLFAAGAMLLAAAPLRAASDCPVESGNLDRVEQSIEAAPTCAVAYRLMNACRRNTSSDVELARIVIAKCERSFVTRGQSARLREYNDERAACAKKYARQQGTMYASFQASCEAGVAAKYGK